MPTKNVLSLGRALDAQRLRELRRTLELGHHKWDAQVGDETALATAPLLISCADWKELAGLAESLAAETEAVERELLGRPDLFGRLGLPAVLGRLLRGGRPTPTAARVMRFDFHWTADGWRLSEVNSDVPGGFTEATELSRLMAAELGGVAVAGDPTAALVDALAATAGDGVVALTCAPGFMEDQQVVAHLAAALEGRGCAAELTSLEQLRWSERRAELRTEQGGRRAVGAIFRFFQAEWLAALRPGGWRFLFVDGVTPCANPGPAALTESKRLPLVWDRLQTPVPTWRRLLPETRELGDAPWSSDDGWLIKSAYCNNGDTVSIRSAMSAASWSKRRWQVRLQPKQWLAQRRFDVSPLHDERGALFPCIGVYVIDGNVAGAYARVTRSSFIDFTAMDAALLIYDDE